MGLYFTAQNLKTTQDTASENLRLTRETLRLWGENQITERLTRAIDQLGNGKLEIRLGGTYALERIARDSEKDYSVVLSAFVRENSPVAAKTQQSLRFPQISGAALTVFGRSRTWSLESGVERILDLAVNLQGLRLEGADLAGISFFGTNLKGALLSGCSFTTCTFNQVNLDGALIASVKLGGCSFNNASLKQANLGDSSFRQNTFSSANLGGAILIRADCESASFDNANPKQANFRGANLRKAAIFGADLTGANFDGAHLEGADLSNVKGLTRAQIANDPEPRP